MYTDLHQSAPLFLSDFHETCIFATAFSKNTQISNSMKIRPVAAERAGGRTDEANTRFSPFFKRA
jgi:hypothetical protein